jgi:predicted hydrocarbon binding protein/PAS domain-containing protein
VRAYVTALSAVAGLALAGGVFAVVSLWPRDPSGALLGILFALLVGLAFLLERRALVLHFRNLRTISSFDEPVVFLALALLPPLALVPLVACSMTLVQVAARRSAIKAFFNVAAYTTAAAVAAALANTLALSLGWPDLAAASAGLVAYTLFSNVLVAALFARLESRSVANVFRERFALATLWHVVLGLALGVAIVALWSFHPLATLIVLPLGAMAVSFMRLSARAEREVAAHRKLADMGAQLAGTRDIDAVAARVLDTCGDLFVAGRARLELARTGEPRRAWTRDYEGGAAPGKAAIEASIRGKDGRILGVIAIEPARRLKDASRDIDPHLLHVVAGQAAAAVENAWALDEIAAMKDLQQGIVENVPAGVARLDAEGRILQLNSSLRRTLDEGRVIPDGVPLEGVSLVAENPGLRATLQGLREGRAFANRETLVGGRTYLVAGVPLGGLRGGAGSVVLFHDVTGRREAEEALRVQGVTRPVVRRIILNLVGNFNATRFAIADMGRSLAAEIEGDSLEAYGAAFQTMGLGALKFERNDGTGYRFTGDDLLERRPTSLQPTCHLALGFLEGVVGKLHGSKALGSEVRCQSQGYDRCVFVVKPRESEPGGK